MTDTAHASRISTSGTVHPLADVGIVVVAAGRGDRLGAATPKAFVELGGITLLEHCVRTISSLPHPGHLVLVIPADCAAEALEIADEVIDPDSQWSVSVVTGGRERHESVRFGLDALHDSVRTVLVHDAARPLASAALFERVIDEVRSRGAGVVPAVPVVDTLKRVGADGVIHETVDRATLVAVQTPQGFPRESLAAAHETVQLQEAEATVAAQLTQTSQPTQVTSPAQVSPPTHSVQASHPGAPASLPTDDAEVMQRSGGTIYTVPGEEQALKLTTRHDLLLLESFLTSQNGSAA